MPWSTEHFLSTILTKLQDQHSNSLDGGNFACVLEQEMERVLGRCEEGLTLDGDHNKT